MSVKRNPIYCRPFWVIGERTCWTWQRCADAYTPKAMSLARPRALLLRALRAADDYGLGLCAVAGELAIYVGAAPHFDMPATDDLRAAWHRRSLHDYLRKWADCRHALVYEQLESPLPSSPRGEE